MEGGRFGEAGQGVGLSVRLVPVAFALSIMFEPQHSVLGLQHVSLVSTWDRPLPLRRYTAAAGLRSTAVYAQ